jgi:hypothetical protein
MLRCVAVCCSALQCAPRHSPLQPLHTTNYWPRWACSQQHVAVCCSVLCRCLQHCPLKHLHTSKLVSTEPYIFAEKSRMYSLKTALCIRRKEPYVFAVYSLKEPCVFAKRALYLYQISPKSASEPSVCTENSPVHSLKEPRVSAKETLHLYQKYTKFLQNEHLYLLSIA